MVWFLEHFLLLFTDRVGVGAISEFTRSFLEPMSRYEYFKQPKISLLEIRKDFCCG